MPPIRLALIILRFGGALSQANFECHHPVLCFMLPTIAGMASTPFLDIFL
jgi:hypothetical protein